MLKKVQTIGVFTSKSLCNGSKFKGYDYHVEISDGDNTVCFHTSGGDMVTIDNVCSGDNYLGTKFGFDRRDNTFWRIAGWGRNKDTTYKQQEADLLQFLKDILALNIEIRFTEESGRLEYMV